MTRFDRAAMRRAFGLFGLAVFGVVLAGCGSVQNVPVKDNNSPAVAVRATYHSKVADAGGEKYGAGVEVGFESYRASDTQTLASGQFVAIEGGTRVNGPDTLNHDARVQELHLAYNHRIRFGEQFQLEPFVGVSRTHLKFNSSSASGANIPTFDESKVGIIGGVTPRWRFNESWAVEARMSYSVYDGGWAHGQSYEAAVVMNPHPQVAVRLGYSERRYDIEPFLNGWFSEVNVRARGPVATLQFEF